MSLELSQRDPNDYKVIRRWTYFASWVTLDYDILREHAEKMYI